MKKTLCILLALLIAVLSACAFAEAAADDPYEVAADEMLRHLEIRTYNGAISMAARNEGIDSYMTMLGFTGPESMENYPNGLVLDRDNNCVLIISDEQTMSLYCSTEENAAEITAGFALLCGLYCTEFEDPAMWERKDGEFTEHDFDYAVQWIRSYMDISGQRKLFSWTSLNNYEQSIHNMMARINAIRCTASVIEDWGIIENLVYEKAPDAVIVDHENHFILVQTTSQTYAFIYAEGCDDSALQWMISNVYLAGTELYDLYVYQIWPDDDTEHTSGWADYEEISSWYAGFLEQMWVPGVDAKTEAAE